MSWLPLDPVLLRLGLYIKIDHPWLDHPFVRNTFTISSPTEIAIIRKYHLTRLFYDTELSHADVVAIITDPSASVEEFQIDAETAQDAEADEQSILKEKHKQIQAVLQHRKEVEENTGAYIHARNEISVMLAMANAGQADMLRTATKIMGSLDNALQQKDVALSLVCAESNGEPGQELAMQAMNVSALAVLTAKTMGLA